MTQPTAATVDGKRKRKANALPKLSEQDFQDQQLLPLLKLNGYRLMHMRNVEIVRADGSTHWACPQQGDDGFIDIVAANAGRMLCLELKTDDASESDLTAGQLEWLNALGGVTYDAWWWMRKKPEPNHVTFGDDSGWDRLVAVVRPMHWDWIEATFTKVNDLLPIGV